MTICCTGTRSLTEQFRLLVDCGGGLASRDADDTQDFHFGKRRAWNENPQAIPMEIWWRQANAVDKQVEQVVGDNPFLHVIVAEAKAHPEPIELGAAEERLALRLEVVTKLANKVNALDGGKLQRAVFAAIAQKFDALLLAQVAGIQVALCARAIKHQDHYFLVGRRRNAFFRRHVASLGWRVSLNLLADPLPSPGKVLRNESLYVIVAIANCQLIVY